MKIGGINTLTLLDYPGKVAAIVFSAGCNFRCGYCHNVQFVLPEQVEKLKGSFIPEEKFFHFLDERKGMLDGIVISGGEATIYPDLPEFAQKIKAKGFLVKLDTNGTTPTMIQKLLDQNLVDYIAMDVKMPLAEYADLVGVQPDTEALKKSIELIKKSNIDYEFRTTIIDEFHDEENFEQLIKDIGPAKNFTLQVFRPEKTLDPKFGSFHASTEEKMKRLEKIARKYMDNVRLHM